MSPPGPSELDPVDGSNPMTTQMALAKLNRSQNKTKGPSSGKTICSAWLVELREREHEGKN